MALNAKQKMFVAAYAACKNATQAAIEAGYSEKTARQEGSRLLTNADIRSAINFRLAKAEEDLNKKAALLGVTKERLIQELSRVAFADMNDFASINARGGVTFKATSERKAGTGRAIKKLSESTSLNGGSTSLELHSKDRAQELLCKLLGWTKSELALNLGGSNVQVVLTMPANGSEAPKPEKE